MATDESMTSRPKLDEVDYLWNRRQALKVRALSNRLYQLERQRVMELREGLVKVASLSPPDPLPSPRSQILTSSGMPSR